MKFDIFHIALLANLSLKKDEEKKLEKQLEETLSYVKILDELDTSKTRPTAQSISLRMAGRKDEASPSLSQEDALKNAKSTQNGFFKVKGILQNE